MSFTYTFSKIDKMGEPHETYGQAYWALPNEDLKPIKFNSQNENIGIGDTIEAEERVEKRSAKGTDYYQLKKVKVVATKVDDVSGFTAGQEVIASIDGRPPELGIVNSGTTQLDRIEEKLDQLLGNRDITEIPDET